MAYQGVVPAGSVQVDVLREALGEGSANPPYGQTPTRTGATQAAVATTGSTSTTPFGYTTAAQADAIVTLLNEIRLVLVGKGLMQGS